MLDAQQIAGVALVAIVLMFVPEAIAYRRGFTGAFWRMGTEEKLGQIAEHGREWRAMQLAWIPILGLLVGGTAGAARLLTKAGEGVPATAGAAVVTLSAGAWLVGVAFMGAGSLRAATEARERGRVPGWIHPMWAAGEWLEGAFVLGANAGFLAIGLAMVRGEFLASWVGWAVAGVAGVVIVGVLWLRDGFPHLALLPALVLGVGLLVP
jgi:hypothetical protein